MEIGSIKKNNRPVFKIILTIGSIFILFWIVILSCVFILMFTSGDNRQLLPDDYESNNYDYTVIDEPYYLSYEEDLKDFNVDKDYLDYEGSEIDADFYQEVMESDPIELINPN